MDELNCVETKLRVPARNFDPAGHEVLDEYDELKGVKVWRFEFTRAGSPESVRLEYDAELPSNCEHCGAYLRWRWREEAGEIFASSRESCAIQQVKPYEIRVRLDSGELVVNDTLFTESNPAPERDYETMSLNNAKGRENYARLLEEGGSLFGSIANRFPSCWINRETNEILIAAAGHSEDDEERSPEAGFEFAGSIGNSVWAYQLADHALFPLAHERTLEEASIISVTPGAYVFQVENDLGALEAIEFSEPVIYARGKLEG